MAQHTAVHPLEIHTHRVGPDGTMAADGQFGLALTTLWHAVSLAGGAVGFVPSVARADVAARAAAAVTELRAAKASGIALIADRQLVGFGMLTAGTGLMSHTGEIAAVMVDPALQGTGLGGGLMTEILALARLLGLERVSLSIRQGAGLDAFYARFGFVECGRRPGWVRVADGDDRDDIWLWLDLGQLR
ncbi:MAG: GNAT family N-acetyltransferase [Actinomycetota bacterium]|nr:GNAT family N-acetyltransferase [Actinomycetota bacterium]